MLKSRAGQSSSPLSIFSVVSTLETLHNPTGTSVQGAMLLLAPRTPGSYTAQTAAPLAHCPPLLALDSVAQPLAPYTLQAVNHASTPTVHVPISNNTLQTPPAIVIAQPAVNKGAYHLTLASTNTTSSAYDEHNFQCFIASSRFSLKDEPMSYPECGRYPTQPVDSTALTPTNVSHAIGRGVSSSIKKTLALAADLIVIGTDQCIENIPLITSPLHDQAQHSQKNVIALLNGIYTTGKTLAQAMVMAHNINELEMMRGKCYLTGDNQTANSLSKTIKTQRAKLYAHVGLDTFLKLPTLTKIEFAATDPNGSGMYIDRNSG